MKNTDTPGIVRRPDRAEGGITAAEKIRLDAHAELWIRRALRTEPINRAAITEAVIGLYAAAKLPAPRIIIVPWLSCTLPSKVLVCFASSMLSLSASRCTALLRSDCSA